MIWGYPQSLGNLHMSEENLQMKSHGSGGVSLAQHGSLYVWFTACFQENYGDIRRGLDGHGPDAFTSRSNFNWLVVWNICYFPIYWG